MKGAAALEESNNKAPNINNIITIGASHHFLLVFKKPHNSPKNDVWLSSSAILEKSGLGDSLMDHRNLTRK
jgi:hypothetical protein